MGKKKQRCRTKSNFFECGVEANNSCYLAFAECDSANPVSFHNESTRHLLMGVPCGSKDEALEYFKTTRITGCFHIIELNISQMQTHELIRQGNADALAQHVIKIYERPVQFIHGRFVV